ncbi:MAG: CHAD domain-containing protein [Caldilineaceae bacterium]
MTTQRQATTEDAVIDAFGLQTLAALCTSISSEDMGTASNGANSTISLYDTAAFDWLRLGLVLCIEPGQQQVAVKLYSVGQWATDALQANEDEAVLAQGTVRSMKRVRTPQRWPKSLRKVAPQLVDRNELLQPTTLLPETADGGIQPSMSMADACRLLLLQQLVNMICYESGVRFSNDIEYVHQTRVSIRRLRAAAKLFGQKAEQKNLQPYLKWARKTGKLLGPVRDLDVALFKAQQQKKKQRAASQQIQAWQAERAAAHADLVEWLDSPEYRHCLAKFHAFCTAPMVDEPSESSDDQSGKPQAVKAQAIRCQPSQVRHVVPTLLTEQMAAVRCYETIFEQTEPIPYAMLHALRIQCKYLRYSLGFTEQFYWVTKFNH